MKLLYLHGFASGPESSKGMALAAHFAAQGLEMERLNLRVPSLEHLRLSEMISSVRRAVGGRPAVIFGSSLGGLAAARVAEAEPSVRALVLLAPAFGFVETWRRRLGPAMWESWRREGLAVKDYARGGETRVDFGFIEDAEKVEAAGPPDVRVPTLIVHGVHDETVGVEESRAWARGRPLVTLVETDDGHELKASLPDIKSQADAFLISLFPDWPRRTP